MGLDRSAQLAAEPRWGGQRHRMEVWYASITDPVSGTGLWVHYELVAPDDPTEAPYRHGWIAVFPRDDEPTHARFGPEPTDVYSLDGVAWFRSTDGAIEPSRLWGSAGEIDWDLTWTSDAAPLWTFPRAAWARDVLPGAQVVPVPTGSFTGTVHVAGHTIAIDGAPGNVAHIYGHGSAKRWGWLHADLGGGDVLEVVTATSMTPGLDRLPPLAFLRLRADGRDWPGGLLPSVRTRTQLDGHEWSVTGAVGRRRLRIEVTQPRKRCVALTYTDPDGRTATCTNSEVSDATIVVEDRSAGWWRTSHQWLLVGTAHAEFGTRP